MFTAAGVKALAGAVLVSPDWFLPMDFSPQDCLFVVLRVSTNFLVDTGHCAGYTVEHLKFPVLSPTVRLSEFPDENDVEPLFTVSATWTASLMRRLFYPGLP